MSKHVYSTALDLSEDVLMEANKYFFGTENTNEVKKLFESEPKVKTFVGYYSVTDCEHEGDINTAITEVTKAGGVYMKTISELKDTDEDIDDYYESRNWWIVFYCDTEKDFKTTCRKLGIR